MTRWAIHATATGHLLGTFVSDTHPRFNGYDWPGDGSQAATAIDDDIDPAVSRWDASALAFVEDLTIAQASAAERVNAEAEAFRLRFLTPGAGQAATYLRKETEARAWVSGADPATAPFLACEAESTGMDVDEVAALVIAQADAWITMGSRIEGLRRGAAVAIEAATTPAQIADAATVDWASLLA